MAEWWQDDDAVDLHYRNRYKGLWGYDPLDPPEIDEEDETEDDLEEVWNGE